LNALRNRLAVAFSYLAIVGCLWGPFSLHSGMPGDTGFTYVSEISRWWNGFFNGSDLLRVHISNFYQVSYLIGELTGFGGSWIPYQIVYAILWWARGYLIFVIGRRLLPGYDLFWYLVGVFVLIHSSDQTIGWVGQMHQSAYILWMLLAFYLLVLVFQGIRNPRARVYLVVAAFLLHLSLWTYESQILLIVLAPFLLQRFYRLPWRRWTAITIAWCAVPAIYVVVAAVKYARSGGNTYQQSVLRKSWQVGDLLHDWMFNIAASLSVWTWPGAEPAKTTAHYLVMFAAISTVVFLMGYALLRKSFSASIPERRTLWAAMFIGLLLLVFSFPVYLVLDSATSLWRTQILAGLGAALIFASAINLCAGFLSRPGFRVAVIAVLSAIIIGYGSYSALKKAAFHRWVWERYRSVIAAVIDTAPRVKPGTLVILTNVPKDEAGGPLGTRNLWFDIAMRLAYPGTPVDGIYFYSDGTPPSDAGLKTGANGHWALDKPGAALLVMEYQPQASAIIVHRVPDFLSVEGGYFPDSRIEPSAAFPRALRRYGRRLP
jgi:hypothetical protein